MGGVMDKDIKNYRLVDFLKQDEETIYLYATLLSHLKPMETKNEIFHMKLKDVDFIKQAINSGDIDDIVESVARVQELEKEEVLRMKIVQFYGLLNSIKEQILTIVSGEETALVSNHVNYKWEAVNGGERMSKFGIYNTLYSLSNGDITKFEKIMDTSYSDVFTTLYMKRMYNDLEHEMSNIKTNN